MMNIYIDKDKYEKSYKINQWIAQTLSFKRIQKPMHSNPI